MSTATPPPLLQKAGKDPANELKSASQVFWLYAFFIGLSLGIVATFSESKPDNVGMAILSCLVVYLLLLVFAGILLFKRKKAGLYLGWTLIPFMLLSFPVGTAVGVFVIIKITNPGVKALLS